jgi:hypothetical protein
VYVPLELNVWESSYVAFGAIEFEEADAVPVPLSLTAAMVKVYAVFPAKVPVAVNGLVVPDWVVIVTDGLLTITYEVIDFPPFDEGGVNATLTTVADVAVAVTLVGAFGVVVAVTELLGEEAGPVAVVLFDTAVKV